MIFWVVMRPRIPLFSTFSALLGLTLLAGLLAAWTLRADEQPRARLVASTNVVTPGSFTGFGFDQCLAPSQTAMSTWMNTSPFMAVGIYISGDSRACRSQPNLTPTWISTQLAAGWRLLPITLGPQASCTTRERYLQQVRINPSTSNGYYPARAQGVAEARKAITAASALGIAKGSTLWYDLEAFDVRRSTSCTESAKWFVSAWTWELHRQGWVSGYYSSAASGVKMLDDARVLTPGRFLMPDQMWIADWNGRADVYSSYVRSDGWMPRKRVHQYQGGHNETWGGVTINIDRNWLDLGQGSTIAPEPTHCGGVSYNPPTVTDLGYGRTNPSAQVKTLQCLLRNQGFYRSTVIDGRWNAELGNATARFRAFKGWSAGTVWTRSAWMALFTNGAVPVVKYGSAGTAVRRVQRALNASGAATVPVTGVLRQDTVDAVRAYQRKVKIGAYGVVNPETWRALTAGRY